MTAAEARSKQISDFLHKLYMRTITRLMDDWHEHYQPLSFELAVHLMNQACFRREFLEGDSPMARLALQVIREIEGFGKRPSEARYITLQLADQLLSNARVRYDSEYNRDLIAIFQEMFGVTDPEAEVVPA